MSGSDTPSECLNPETDVTYGSLPAVVPESQLESLLGSCVSSPNAMERHHRPHGCLHCADGRPQLRSKLGRQGMEPGRKLSGE